jgi:hypothetical protein
MPFGLWKSKVEIYREENDRRHAEWREDMGRRDAKWREDGVRREAEWREDRARRDAEWSEWKEETRRLNAEWREERAAWLKSHEELRAQIDENHRETMAAFKIVIDELRALRREVRDLTDAVNANTEAILKLIDRFDEWEARPPGSGQMGPRSA